MPVYVVETAGFRYDFSDYKQPFIYFMGSVNHGSLLGMSIMDRLKYFNIFTKLLCF